MRSPHHQLQVERRERHRDNQVYALTTHLLQVERRESHRAQSSGWGLLGGMIDKGQVGGIGQDTGVTPLFFARSAMGFLNAQRVQDLGYTSHRKTVLF